MAQDLEEFFDIQRVVDFLRGEIENTDCPEDAFEMGREAARYQWQVDLIAYHKSQGIEFFNYAGWQKRRWIAMSSFFRARERHRRKMGDLEILDRLATVSARERRQGDYHLTRARCKVIAAVVRLGAESGMIYCSYAGLARKARVSERTAFSVRSELEELGVLVRVRTGGRNAAGDVQSNKYFVRYNILRDLLGVENRWDERRVDPVSEFRTWAMLRRRPNPFFNYDGFAHLSNSERQKRRVAMREREAARLEQQKQRLAVENFEDPRPQRLPRTVENPKNGLFEQAFCALTELKTQKRSFIYQPDRSLLLYLESNVENSTRQSRSLDSSPAGCRWCFDPLQFSQAAHALLGTINPYRIAPLLAEMDEMTRNNPSLLDNQDRQDYAESLLRLLADADKSLFNQTDFDPHQRGKAARQ